MLLSPTHQAEASGEACPSFVAAMDVIGWRWSGADEVGLDAFGVGEHHRSDFVASAPHMVLAAAAATIPVGFYANSGDFDGDMVLNAEVYSRVEIGLADVIGSLQQTVHR